MNDEGFSSDWHTDVLLLEGAITINVALGTNTYDIVTHGYGYLPVHTVQYKVDVGEYWHEPGCSDVSASSPGSTDIIRVECYIVPTTTKLQVVTTNNGASAKAVQFRYWVYENQLVEDIDG